MNARRLLLVHAHPDDETIGTGATMAHYSASGAAVTLITCTLGEEGEILVPELAQLAADQADQLGGVRIGELANAMQVLGVEDHRFLGGAGRFRDSGMIGTSANDNPRAFWRAASDEEVFKAAVSEAVAVIRETRPQVVITYDPNGGYGHPDHIMAHRVTMAAVDAASDPDWRPAPESASEIVGEPWEISKLYWPALPKSLLAKSIQMLKEQGSDFFGLDNADDFPFATPDEDVTTVVDGSRYGQAKQDAMRAHATQISVDGPFFALSNGIGQGIFATEYFQLVRGEVGPDRNEEGHEIDLFSGVA